MKKRTYRRIGVERLDVERLRGRVGGGRVVFAMDVAKVGMVGAFVAEDREVLVTVAWNNPEQNHLVLDVLQRVQRDGCRVEVVMEPSATYGDVLRHLLEEAGIAVFRVNGKRTFDAKEIYDGVPSLHDAKSAAIVARLHLEGASARWHPAPLEQRRLRAAVVTMTMHREHHQRLVHQLEPWLARHWPEVTTLLELTAASLLALLARLGGPADVAQSPERARELLHGMSHGLLKPDKIERILDSARSSAGVPLLREETAMLQAIAEEAHRALRAFKRAHHSVEDLATSGAAARIAPATGRATAVVLAADVGDPAGYSSARAYAKALGLNLKEKSSGKLQGRLAITKRGPSRPRQFLWLAVCRWMQRDRLARAWYEKKIERDGGTRAKALVALMRKFAKALFHVARGAPFDSARLFDARRLSTRDAEGAA